MEETWDPLQYLSNITTLTGFGRNKSWLFKAVLIIVHLFKFSIY